MKHPEVVRHLLRALAIVAAVPLLTAVVFAGHGEVLTAALMDLVLVMLIAYRWGFIQTVIASVLAVTCMDYFYMPPVFTLYERDPQDWISSGMFVSLALAAGYIADRIKRSASQNANERTRLEKLYLTSRDVIMLDRRGEVGAQLTRLIADTFNLDAVALWDAREARMDKAGKQPVPEDEVRAAYFGELNENDLASSKFTRTLRIGTRPIGALYIAGPCHEAQFDSRSVDAIASLASIALERAHSFIAESDAEAAKRSEQLRSAVLDGLAHAFKTPLATIQNSSSGLLEMKGLGNPERELVFLIDEQATRLTKLANQALRTAKLDEGQLKVDYECISMDQLLRCCREEAADALSDHALRTVDATSGSGVWADAHLLQMALWQMLDNAAKYARPASPITLQVASTDTEIVFSVLNEGSFIAPEERLRIFQRFYRSPGSQHKASGTGIGLSVTKRIAEAHNGGVWVESDSTEGTTCFLALPRLCKET
jgi:two-component system, OmpR family, sensor histidine kinase KdpD